MSKTSRKFRVPDALANVYDFANTLDLRRFVHHGVRHQTGDEIDSAEKLAAWMAQRGLLERGGRLTPAMFDAAIRLRASIREYLACQPLERHRHRGAIAMLNKAIEPFPITVEASSESDGMQLKAARKDALAGMSVIVAELYNGSANGTLSRLKMCAADECRRVFYDRSKPGTRRWCQAALCGNRMKTRAYRERRRA